MKFGKEEIQKTILSALLLVGLLYCYFAMLIGPLATGQVRAEKSISEIGPQIVEAKKQIQKTEQVKKQLPAADEVLNQLKAGLPEGAPIAWFPPRMTEFFKKQGIEKSQTRLMNAAVEKELPGFQKLIWSVELPKVEFAELGAAVANLENQEPLLQVTNVTIEAMKEDPQFQHATLIVSTLVEQ
jgi:hypothetical protein